MTVTPRVVLVMDAGRYVGPSICKLLLARGHSLVLHDASPELASSLAEMSDRVRVVSVETIPLSGPGSVATDIGARSLVDYCLSEFGAIHAALLRSPHFAAGRLNEITSAQYELVKQNLDISFCCLRALTPAMSEQVNGDIVVLTSAHGVRPTAQFSVYAAVRAAENALMRATALDYANRGVTINAIGTNYMRFPEFRGGWTESLEELSMETPRERMGTMAELAELCALLLEGRARHLLGQTLSFSGGWG